MDLPFLGEVLDALFVPRDFYGLGKVADEGCCIIPERDGWIVFYTERGQRSGEKRYVAFEAAARDFLMRVLHDGAVMDYAADELHHRLRDGSFYRGDQRKPS